MQAFEIIVPEKTTEGFIKLAKSDLSEKPWVELSDRLIKITSEHTSDTTMISKLIDGKFLEYKGLIPANNL